MEGRMQNLKQAETNKVHLLHIVHWQHSATSGVESNSCLTVST